MIITAIVMFIVSILSFFLSMIPSMKIDLSGAETSSFYSIIEHVSYFVPTVHLGIILGIILLVYVAEFLWLLLNWIIAKIPFIE